MTRGTRNPLPLAFPLLAILGSACPGSDPQPAPGCVYDGKNRAVGASFPSTDGCNTCTCEKGGAVACTEKACWDASPTACKRTGCSGQICAEQDVATDCDFRPEYACYQKAVCERQRDGKCGFTPSAELTACLGGLVDGGATATPDAAPRTDAAARCDFSAAYEYGAIGGLRFYVDRSFLAPGNSYKHTRSYVRGDRPDVSCAPAMPPCGAQDVITAYDIEVHDLPLADVQAALAQPTPPLFGRDTRPVDGTVFEFKRADGRGFLVGEDCPIQLSSCRAISPGIKQLRDRLLALDKAQLAKQECVTAGLNTP